MRLSGFAVGFLADYAMVHLCVGSNVRLRGGLAQMQTGLIYSSCVDVDSSFFLKYLTAGSSSSQFAVDVFVCVVASWLLPGRILEFD